MNPVEERTGDTSEPMLRVYHDDDADEAENATAVDLGPSEELSEAELEAFWAGRNSATRHSARVAA